MRKATGPSSISQQQQKEQNKEEEKKDLNNKKIKFIIINSHKLQNLSFETWNKKICYSPELHIAIKHNYNKILFSFVLFSLQSNSKELLSSIQQKHQLIKIKKKDCCLFIFYVVFIFIFIIGFSITMLVFKGKSKDQNT